MEWSSGEKTDNYDYQTCLQHFFFLLFLGGDTILISTNDRKASTDLYMKWTLICDRNNKTDHDDDDTDKDDDHSWKL